MKKKVLIFLPIFVVFAALVLYGLSRLRINETTKNLLLSEIESKLKGYADINNLKMHFHKVSISGIEVSPEGGNFSLSIDRIEIGYSIINFIKNGFNVKSLPEELTIIRPHIKLNDSKSKKGNKSKTNTEAGILSSFFENFEKAKNNVSFLKRINISDGEIKTGDKNISEIKGWVDLGQKAFTDFKFDGKISVSNKNNFRLAGKISIPERKLSGRLGLKKFDLKNIDYHKKHFQFRDGKIDGDFYFSLDSNTKKPEDIVVNGDLIIRDGDLVLLNEKISCEDIFLKGNIKDNNFIIDEFRHSYSNGEIKHSGVIKNIFNPRFDINTLAKRINFRKFRENVLPDFEGLSEGRMFLNFNITGSSKKPQFGGSLIINDFSINNNIIGNIITEINFDGDNLNIRDFDLDSRFGNIKANGDMELSGEQNVSIFINGKQDLSWLAEKIPLLKVKNKEGIIEAGLTGKVDDIEGIFKISYASDDSNAVAGNIAIQDRLLKFRAKSMSKQLDVEGFVDLSNYNWELISVKNPFGFINEIANLPFLSEFERNVDFELKIQKSEDNYSFSGRGYSREKSDKRRLLANINGFSKKEAEKRFINSQIIYNPAPEDQFIFSLEIANDKDKLVFNKFEIPGIFKLSGEIDYSLDNKMDAEFLVKTGFEKIKKLLSRELRTLRSGDIDGLIAFNGTLSNPEISGKVDINNTNINDIAGFNGLVSFDSEDWGNIVVEKIKINDIEKSLFYGNGKIDLNENNMDFSIKGDRIDSEMILEAIDYKKGLISGEIDIDIKLSGKTSGPKVSGIINAKDFKIYNHDFNSLYINLGNPKKINGNKSSSSSLAIRKFSLERKDIFALVGEGYLPLNRNEEIDFLIDGKGDLLSLLPEIEGFFIDGKGEGSFNVRVVGTIDNPTAVSGDIQINDGYLKFSKVFNELKNIQLDASISTEDRFIKIKNLTTLADERRIRISNQPQASVTVQDGKKINLEPMVLRDNGLNWGVLIVETDEKGVRLNIPGLMEKKETGIIHLHGKNPKEKFYFAGPADNPVLRGRVDVRKMNFTYPFITDEDNEVKKGKVERFLESIFWDLSVYAMGDVRYFRVEPSGFSSISDNVYLNISIDEMTNGMDFGKTINDESFRIVGTAVSTRGSIEFYDLVFRVERFEVVFDERTLEPIISGRARATLRDSALARDIYIVPYYKSDDSETGVSDFSLENLHFEFQLNEGAGNAPGIKTSQEEILGMLGYSMRDIKDKAPMVVGSRAENALLRPFMKPIERKIRNTFRLDELTLRPSFAKNITQYIFESSFNLNPSRRLGEKIFVKPTLLFQSSSLVLGKYVFNDFYFSYEGQLVTGFVKSDKEKLGLSHLLGIEYRIMPGVILDLQYDYQFDRYLDREDKRLWLRHYFTLSD